VLIIAHYGPSVNVADRSAWLDCESTVTIEYDGTTDEGEIARNENGDIIREEMQISSSKCNASRDEIANQYSSFSNVSFESNVESTSFISFNFIVFFSAFAISILYFVFWVIRIGSVVRISVVG
jgi:hypothetical protein